ncbi:MAG: ammonium transporter, partial [Candidatus Methanofastidiosa archaeon]|nr:ammonium transporter [Candidatus Methanofastidiosa archaeon]
TSGKVGLLGIQALGAGVTFISVVVLCFLLATAVKATIGIRVPEAIEVRGLDTTEFGADAYPDFIRD